MDRLAGPLESNCISFYAHIFVRPKRIIKIILIISSCCIKTIEGLVLTEKKKGEVALVRSVPIYIAVYLPNK